LDQKKTKNVARTSKRHFAEAPMLLPMIAVFKGCVLGVHRLGVRRVR